ncbi:MAG: DUF4160 domain-containing protein [Candidatus Nomurabacteria bacterium]
MKNNQSQNNIENVFEEFVFDVISADLNNQINNECGQIFQKGIFPTGMNRGIRVYIYSGDHLPIHFHVKSPQRYLDAKFQLDPLRLIENKTSIRIDKDESFIVRYFTQNKHLLDEIRNKFIELNPNLNYEN